MQKSWENLKPIRQNTFGSSAMSRVLGSLQIAPFVSSFPRKTLSDSQRSENLRLLAILASPNDDSWQGLEQRRRDISSQSSSARLVSFLDAAFEGKIGNWTEEASWNVSFLVLIIIPGYRFCKRGRQKITMTMGNSVSVYSSNDFLNYWRRPFLRPRFR